MREVLIILLPLIAISWFFAFLGPDFSSEWSSFSNKYTSLWTPVSPPPPSSNVAATTTETPTAAAPIINETLSDDSDSASSPQPFLLEDNVPILQHQANVTDEEISFRDAINGEALASNSSNIPIIVKAARRQREFTKLERIEQSLRRARASIREANFGNKTHHHHHHQNSSDFLPTGPMYWNANAFHRSYLEMEKEFKIFVYEEGEPPLFHNGPCKSIYSTEGNFIHAIEMDKQFRTKDPNNAHVYFLPVSVAMLVRFVYVRDSHDFKPIRQTMIDYVNVIGSKYPFWNRSLGADHFMLSCHDWGPEASKSLPNLYQNSIRVLCNANTSEGFNPTKDVSFPEINLLIGFLTGNFLGGPSPSHRPILAFFAGGLHGPIRPILLEQWENNNKPYDENAEMQIHRYLPKGVSYIETMRKSKYCICPSGYEVASPRIVEAIYTGCVPVLISDHYIPPFSDVLNWKAFSVEVSVDDIPNLKNILMGISNRQYLKMYRRVVKVRKHFEVNSPPKRFDVYHMILHSIWLRRLNVRVRDLRRR